MAALIRSVLARGKAARLLALGALLGLLAAGALSLAPAAADGHLGDMELVLSAADESDNIVPPDSTVTINAALRFSLPAPATLAPGLPSYTTFQLGVPAASVAASDLRLSGFLEWNDARSWRLAIPTQNPLFSRITSTPGAQRQIAKALDGRTLVIRTSSAFLNIFDSYTLEHKARINRPAGSNGTFHEGFGSTAGGNFEGGFVGSAISLWHETAARAWLFVGSWNETVEGRGQMGRLHIYRLDWDDDGVTVTSQGSLAPPLSEASNRPVGTSGPRYGAGVDISRDGGTLAVSAPRMNEMGAIYVYSRPDGAGEDWGDITYADGVKVSAAEVPSFGVSTSTMPFDPTVDYDASNPRSCGDWCQAVWSNLAGNPDGVELGNTGVSLSADGRVLVAGAREKEFDSTERPTNANRRNNAGEVFVWVAPDGGWASAPRADRNADGDPRTLFAARTDATNFRRATHYSPGPLRRWTEPAAILIPQNWPGRAGHWFGQAADVSPDGAVVVASDLRSGETLHVFQRNSADDWKTLNGGYLYTPSVSYSNAGRVRNSGIQFNFDGTEMVTGDTNRDAQRGALQVFSQRPQDDGVWTSSAARRWVGEFHRELNKFYGFAAHELTGRRVAMSQGYGSRVHLTGLTTSNGSGGGCSVTLVDGVRTATCPLTLSNAEIVIPKGTPDGPFTITGKVALQVSRSSGSAVTLRDTLELTIGTVDELAEVKFGFADDPSTGQPYPSLVEPGGSTTLLLSALNENGKASAKGALSDVLFTTTRGSLSAALGDAAGEACVAAGGDTCQLSNANTALTGSNSDKIRLTVSHPGASKAGEAVVEVDVIGPGGEVFEPEPLRISFAGVPTELAIAPPPTALLGRDPSGATDQRNVSTLVVSAVDSNGAKASVPDGSYSATLSDSDGKAVAASRASVEWPLREGGAEDGALVLNDGDPQARVTVLAGASAPLAAGEYTLKLSAGAGGRRVSDTQTIIVTGGAAAIALSAEPAGVIEVGATVTVTATVSDASGAAAPDGTPVMFSEQSISPNTVLVLLSPSRQLTSNGEASVTARALGLGSGYVRAEADNLGEIQPVTVVAPPPAALDDAAAGLTVDAFNTWTGPRATRASELYGMLEGVSQLSKWDGVKWVSYGETDGLLNSGSTDFSIVRGTVLWLDGR